MITRVLIAVVASLPLLVPTTAAAAPGGSPTVKAVRDATAQYRDVQAAIDAGYSAGPCVSGPNGGAMGVHFINGDALFDAVLDINQPEALIYEPQQNGRFRLVGVEFIVIAEDWDAMNSDPPVLLGHLLNFVGAPNRYRLPAFYEMHVWAWRSNPDGTFSDWNPAVTCSMLQLPT